MPLSWGAERVPRRSPFATGTCARAEDFYSKDLMATEWYGGIVFVVVAVGVSIAGVDLVRRYVSADLLKRHNEVAVAVHAALAAVYAVLLAFVVVTVWDQYNDAEKSVSDEAGQISGLYRGALAFGDSTSRLFRADVSHYITSVIDYEWPLMQEENLRSLGNPSYNHLWTSAQGFVPRNKYEEIWLAVCLQKLEELDNSRNMRIYASESEIPGAMWGLLICGAVVTVAFACFFGAERRLPHVLMVAALSSIIAFVLFMIATIDHPFVGLVHVDSDAFHHALVEVDSISSVPSHLKSLPEQIPSRP